MLPLQINQRLKEIDAAGGVDAEVKRIGGLAEYFRNKIKDSGLPFKVISNSLPNAVTALSPTNGTSANDIFITLKDEYGIWACPNGGAMADEVFRIGHLGHITPEDLKALLDALHDMNDRGLLQSP